MGFIERLASDIRKALRQAERAGQRNRSRVAAPTNVVIAHNVGEPGSVARATATQRVRIRNGEVVERYETRSTATSPQPSTRSENEGQ